jgi:protein TonB
LRTAHGSVLLQAHIGKDGSVQDLRLLEGGCAASEAVMSAVRQWRYSPTLVNGEPAEVDTTLTVVFDPGNP